MARWQVRGRLPGLATCLLLAPLLTAVGVLAGVWPLWRTLDLAWQSRHWVAVPAVVEHQQLHEGRKGMLRLEARYHYDWQGQRHRAERVGLDEPGHSDNLDCWARDWSERLARAQGEGETLTAWVDPAQPDRALLDRSLRWPVLLLHLPFALDFTGLGLLAGWLGVAILRRRAAGAEPPPLQVPPWALLALFGLLWCGLCTPLTLLFWLSAPGWVSALLALLFNGVGLGLLVLALQARRTPEGGAALRPAPVAARRARSDPTPPPLRRLRRTVTGVVLGGIVAKLIWLWVSVAPPSPPLGATPAETLQFALDHGDLPRLQRALDAGASPDQRLDNGDTVLMSAAREGQLPLVDALLRHGADPQARDETSAGNRGDTALLVAAFRGQAAVFERLLAAGARLDLRNMWDWGPVHMAAQGGCLPCLDELARRGQPLDERAPASQGETPAMLAAARGRVDALAWLAEHGADLHARDASGRDALAYARWRQQARAEAWLLQRGVGQAATGATGAQ